MTTWASGYVSDIEYTRHFFRELAPGYLRFVCLAQGKHPPSIGAGATYCELGCGQGVTTAILAAANPQMQFWGIDFNPAQIANARRLARDGGLANVTFLDYSFEQCLALPAGALPQFDYITLHGIYSWVTAENRRFLIELLDRHLKPGGAVYISYNTLPGWSGLGPLQRLFSEYAKRYPDRSDVQAKGAIALARMLSDAKVGYFAAQPGAVTQLNKLVTSDAAYLAHEYLNGNWDPMYHADVARQLEAARLNYVGSATLIENLDKVTVPEKMLPLLRESRDPVWRETLRDFATHQRFRRDIFMRGASSMKTVEHSDALADMRLALLVPRASALAKITSSAGQVSATPDIINVVLDALAHGPRRIADLAALPALAGKPGPVLMEAVTLLMHCGQVHPVLAESEPESAAAARRLNHAIAGRIRYADVLGSLAAPAVGTGIGAGFPELVAILAHVEGMKPDPAEVARFAWPIMFRTGQRMFKDKGKVKLETPEANIAELETQLQRIYGGQLATWQELGVI